jgi:putative hydrolase of the HAD superfamily
MPGPLTTRAVLFDLYRTLIDIWTNEKDPRVWDGLSRFLAYQGVWLQPQDFSARFSEGASARLKTRQEEHAEIDISLVFRDILADAGCTEPESLSKTVTGVFRVLSTERFRLFPDVIPALESLAGRFALGVVSDAQRAFFHVELEAAGLVRFMDVTVASGEHGFHKPDPRLFRIALDRLGLDPAEAVYVGDSADRDMCGAQAAGIRGVLLDREGRKPVLDRCRPHRVVRDLDELCRWLLAGD